jgi:competence protein ComGC
MDEQFLGAGNMEILFESETEGVFKDPEVLLALESIKIILEDRYPNLVTHNWTLNNQIKQTHQKLNENRIEAYSIPNQPELVAQLLVLIEGGDYENLGRMVSLDYTRARMSVSLKTLGSKKIGGIAEFRPA